MPRLALLAAVLASAFAPVPASAAAGDLRLLEDRRLGSRLHELTFRTPALAGPVDVRVLLPAGYARSRKRYPVLYLLHGASGNATSWTEQGDAEEITRGRELIVVMPDGGTEGLYTDWFNGGRGGPPRWETFHVDQLLPWVDRRYRTHARRSARAVAGLSMGGLGTASYAARHPDRFVSAAAYSGAVDIDGPLAAAVVSFITGADDQNLPFGPRASDRVRWQAHDPGSLAPNLRSVQLTLRTGNGKPGGPFGGGDFVEQSVYVQNVALHARLRRERVRHLWDDYGPGGHTWPYWQRDLRQDLPRFMATFRRAPGEPRTFEHVAVEPRYDVFGWDVAVRRRAPEFSRLARTGPRAFAVAGSGTATVTTPRLARPGRRLSARLRGRGGTRTVTVRADRRGRVRLRVPLGPANAGQEERPGVRTRVYTTRVALR